jgi:hypothetical protein
VDEDRWAGSGCVGGGKNERKEESVEETKKEVKK